MVKLMAFMICLHHANYYDSRITKGFPLYLYIYIFFQDKGNKLTNII